MAISTIGQNSISGLGYGFKNRLINGGMVVDQRNAGASKTLVAGTSTYVLDRFYVATNGGTGSVQQVAGTGGFTKAMRITGASGVTDGYFGQKVESYNIADCASSTVTYKIRASSSVLTSLSWYARFPTAQDNYAGVTSISNGSITINSTPTDYSFQIALPSGVTNGFEVYFTFGSFTSGTLDITGVQLEKGTTATSFDYRPYGTELALCQRYYQKYYGQAYNGVSAGVMYGTTNYLGAFPYMQPMRSGPSLTYSGLSEFCVVVGGTAPTPTGIYLDGATTTCGRISATTPSTTQGQGAFLQMLTSTAWLALSAEL